MENELIAWLRARLPGHARMPLGPGDDAAVLDWSARQCVVSSDLLADGVHFHLDRTDPRRIGRKAIAVNLSDMAAMAARPVGVTVSLLLPRNIDPAVVHAFYEGLIETAERFDVAVAGGDTNSWDGSLVVAVTIWGEPTERGVLRRGDARVGDVIVVTGPGLGGSLAGWHLDFSPRVGEAYQLHRDYRLHAGMDLSDGLSVDLPRLAAESGVGAEIDAASVPISASARQMAREPGDVRTPLEHALHDGEDFELLLALPADEARRLLADQPLAIPITAIGRIVESPGVWLLDESGRRPLEPRGYVH